MASEDELWELVTSEVEGVLVTIGSSGRPQLSNIVYVLGTPRRSVRLSTTADRVKSRNIVRDPRACLHVTGEDFWHFAVAEGTASISETATRPDDAVVQELAEISRLLYGSIDERTFGDQMVAERRVVLRLEVERLYGVLTESGPRPRRTDR